MKTVAWQVYAKGDKLNTVGQAWEFIQHYIATQIPNDELPDLEYDESREVYYWSFVSPHWAVRITEGIAFTELVKIQDGGNPDPWEGYHGPNADDGTLIEEGPTTSQVHEIQRYEREIERQLANADDGSCVHCGTIYGDHDSTCPKYTEIDPKPYMSVDRNFRVTIHEGSNDEVS